MTDRERPDAADAASGARAFDEAEEPRGSNLAQRIVAVVALAAILWLVGAYLTSPVPFTGWTGYAPLQTALARVYVARDGLAPVANLFVWFGLVLGWVAGSLLLLRGPVRGRVSPRRR